MARILIYTRDLLFSSSLESALRAAGHSVSILGEESRLRAELSAHGQEGEAMATAPVLVLDFSDETLDATRLARTLRSENIRTHALGYYSHVDPAAKEVAEEAGVRLVVPRSRMTREAPELIERLLAGAG